ncbi:MAG: ABC transporter substrate-binding protein [Treponema sp.]|jgi:NitT/TauT family transport system substrate-binding protein|nr:ABC transporter substrate-binding protein [Treponema sp.]
MNPIKTVFIISFSLLAASLWARPAHETSLTVYGLKGPSGVGMIRMFENPPVIPGFEVKMEALAQADLMAARFISQDAKVGILPANIAAKIAASGRNIRIAAVTGTGMLSLLTSDPQVGRIEDLRGKTVEVAGQGATPDYVFRRLLKVRGIDPEKDLTLSYSLAYPEIAQSLIAGRVSVALLPEPFSTMALSGNPGLRRAGDIQEEWSKAGGQGNYPMTALVLDGDFAAYNPGAVKIILENLKDSIEWTAANPAAAGALVEKHDFGLKASVAAAAIPRSNYVFIPAAEARPSIEALFRVFLEFSPDSIGGAMPGDHFYYP